MPILVSTLTRKQRWYSMLILTVSTILLNILIWSFVLFKGTLNRTISTFTSLISVIFLMTFVRMATSGSSTPSQPQQQSFVIIIADESYTTKECNICLNRYKIGDEIRLLNCGHRNHNSCMEQWGKDCVFRCHEANRNIDV